MDIEDLQHNFLKKIQLSQNKTKRKYIKFLNT